MDFFKKLGTLLNVGMYRFIDPELSTASLSRQFSVPISRALLYRGSVPVFQHLRKQSKIGYNTMGNVVIEGTVEYHL